MSNAWFSIRTELSPGRSLLLKVCSFLLPLGVWAFFSYVPLVTQQSVRVTSAGDGFIREGLIVDITQFEQANAKLKSMGWKPATGEALPAERKPLDSPFLPPPHKVLLALVTAFKTEPGNPSDPWYAQSLGHSLWTIGTAFALSAAIAVPVGLLCGTFNFFSKLIEPVVDFTRYMPPPVFGGLAVVLMGVNDMPKITIIVIGALLPLIRVIANTTRQIDQGLLEAALTLGASKRRLVTHVILPGILPSLYNDLRITLGVCWTLLTVAELIGQLSGLTQFIYRQQVYFHYDNVYAGIITIGLMGMFADKVLTVVGTRLFPWQGKPQPGIWGEIWSVFRGVQRRRGRPLMATIDSAIEKRDAATS